MNTELQRLTSRELALPLGSLGAYIRWANQVPILTAEEELFLANDFRNNGNLEAARRLVMAHLRFVVSIARNYQGYGLTHADLIQEGSIGLMKAVKRFDPSMGVRLVSFAVHWIKAEIHEFVLRNWRIVKVATTKAQRKLFFNLRRLSKPTSWLSNQEAQSIAKDLNVSTNDVFTMEARLNSVDESIETFGADDDDTEWKAPINHLEDHRFNPAIEIEHLDSTQNRETVLKAALATLDVRSQDILKQRWLTEDKATLHDLAAKYNVSAERIRQLEQQAMAKIKKTLQ
jgi:RNA polymerase sigma-32 factor